MFGAHSLSLCAMFCFLFWIIGADRCYFIGFWKGWRDEPVSMIGFNEWAPWWTSNIALNNLPSQVCSLFIVYQWWTGDLALFSQSLRAQPTVELRSTLIKLHTPHGASDQQPYSSLTIHLFIPPSVSISQSAIPLPLSLFCSLFLSSLVLSIHPSVLISREASPINLFKQPSEHPIHSNVAVWERASSLSQDPNARPPYTALLSLCLHFSFHFSLIIIIIIIIVFLRIFLLSLNGPDCSREQDLVTMVSLLFSRAEWHLMHSLHHTLNNLNGCSHKLYCLWRSPL